MRSTTSAAIDDSLQRSVIQRRITAAAALASNDEGSGFAMVLGRGGASALMALGDGGSGV